MQAMGKILIVVGLVIVGIGTLLTFFDRLPFLGKLPGDISIKRDNFQFFFPITTSILVSVVISLVLWIVSQFKGK
jgi:hypothetical protein